MNESLSIDDIFCTAIELNSPEARASYLSEVCEQNADLRRQVQRLLDAHFRGGSIIDAPEHLLNGNLLKHRPEQAGAQIGPYKLLQQIGEGGMGVVWMAEQSYPVERRIALKIIKPGIDTRQIIARFEAERQALAVMDHPHIAKILDAGETETGRPYFVLELVRGQSITQYCDEHRLTPRERLQLFIPVCQAIQHAHQKGIIHRDIKPSNVLIAPYDGKPVVKVIDFGVAKATGQRLTERTLFTEFGAVLGTLEYMSPEQAELNNQDIDTRSDIYSLGVLLYELLTGSTPLTRDRLKSSGLPEMLRMIRDEDPPRPSTRLSTAKAALPTVSQQRNTEPRQLTRIVRGELDWIVMKALDKDRSRRYETANGLAADVQRYLNDEPVQACPPSVRYLVRKFVHRNLSLVTAASLVLAALLIAIAATTWGMVQSELGRSAAEDARAGEAIQRDEAVANLYDSLIGEARALRLARITGYRKQAWQRLRQAAQLETPRRNMHDLRTEAAAGLGDFVGLEPTILKDFANKKITAIALHPQAFEVAIGFSDGSLTLRRLPSGTEIASWNQSRDDAIQSIAFAAHGTSLACLAEDGTITLRELDVQGNWAAKWTASISSNPSSDSRATIAFTPDALQLVVASSDGPTIRFWRVADGQATDSIEASGQLAGLMALSADGELLAAVHSGNGGNSIGVWKLATGQLVKDFASKITALTDLEFSPDCHWLGCCGGSGTAVFETTTFERHLFFLSNAMFDLSFSPDSQLLAGGTHGATMLWDIVTNREVALLRQPIAPEDPAWSDFVYSVSVSNDGKTLASASRRRLVLWNLGGAAERVLLKRFAAGVPAVVFSPQGDLLASVSQDRTVALWNAVTGELVRNLTGLQGGVQCVTFSPDGSLLATGDWSGRESIRIWDANTGENLIALNPQLGGIWSVAFSCNGQSFAAGGDRGWAIWKFGRREQEVTLEPLTQRPNKAGVGCLCFTPDGSLLARVDRDLTFHLWDLTAERERPAPVNKMGRFVNSIAPDTNAPDNEKRGKCLRLWLADDQESGELWDFGTGQRVAADAPLSPELAVVPDKSGNWSRAVNPDKTRWAVGFGDGSLVLWDLDRVRALLNEAGLGWEPRVESSTVNK